jgi:hypothetical protein
LPTTVADEAILADACACGTLPFLSTSTPSPPLRNQIQTTGSIPNFCPSSP